MKLIGTNYLTVIRGGKTYRMEDSNPLFRKAYDLLTKDNDEQGFIDLAGSKPEVAALKGKDGFVVDGDTVTFKGYVIEGALKTKVLSMLGEDLDLAPFENFVDRLKNNPSNTAVRELFDFLGYKELAITPEGFFIAYKGVESNYYSKTGNKNTKVVQGKVDSQGRIYNGVGETIEVERNSVDDDRRNECSHGLHAGSLDYARGFAARLVMVLIDPADVVSVPADYQFQKLRCSKYVVVSDFQEEVAAPVAKVDLVKNTVTPTTSKPKNNEQRIQNYIAKKATEGEEYVSLRSISNAFSPEYIKVADVRKAVQRLGYTIEDGYVEI